MKHTFPSSNHVAGFDYDPTTKVISVHFKNGKSYTHLGVPQEAVDNFVTYRSPGQHYHGVIKKYKLVK